MIEQKKKRARVITITRLQVKVPAIPGHSLLNSLLHAAQPVHTVCGGRAGCGCCRIRIISTTEGISPINERERGRLSSEELAAGWRLACQTHTLRDIVIDLPTADELPDHCSSK